ncbi:hypothetical protein HN51_041025 [Arachis hypogaea]
MQVLMVETKTNNAIFVIQVKAHLKIVGSKISACKKVNANFLIKLKNINEQSTKVYERPHISLPSENRQVIPVPSASST